MWKNTSEKGIRIYGIYLWIDQKPVFFKKTGFFFPALTFTNCYFNTQELSMQQVIIHSSRLSIIRIYRNIP